MKLNQESSPEKILGMAVKSEIEAADVYSKLYEIVKNELLRKKLKFLLYEEKKHRRILERLYTQKFPQKKMVVPEKSFLPSIKVSIDENTTMLDIFNVAFRAEKMAEDFYSQTSQQTQDERSQKILQYLSRVERSHSYMIKSEIDLLEKFPEYYNVEDFHAGHEFVHIGP
ncbi:ferritin family protein [bacterium]|nr:ferritin family protein [bacterium]